MQCPHHKHMTKNETQDMCNSCNIKWINETHLFSKLVGNDFAHQVDNNSLFLSHTALDHPQVGVSAQRSTHLNIQQAHIQMHTRWTADTFTYPAPTNMQQFTNLKLGFLCREIHTSYTTGRHSNIHKVDNRLPHPPMTHPCNNRPPISWGLHKAITAEHVYKSSKWSKSSANLFLFWWTSLAFTVDFSYRQPSTLGVIWLQVSVIILKWTGLSLGIREIMKGSSSSIITRRGNVHI